jgi:hypothetical protein
MRTLDFTSWQSLLTTLLSLVAITFVMVAIRLLVMQSMQARRERENRQINERLRTLIAAYKTLGGSFTGNLAVDPTHLRDLERRLPAQSQSLKLPSAEPTTTAATETETMVAAAGADPTAINSAIPTERTRRIRDAVEAALADVILLGTEEQVRLAAQAANEMVAGRPIHTAELVVSLRNFIRTVLDLEAIPVELTIPRQGPTRPGVAPGPSAKGKTDSDREGNTPGGGGMGGAGIAAGGGGLGLGLGGALAAHHEDEEHGPR